jgi:MFS family permease
MFGLLYPRVARTLTERGPAQSAGQPRTAEVTQAAVWRVSAAVLLLAILGSFIFQSTTFALPEIFDERLGDLSDSLSRSTGFGSASIIGFLTFTVFAAASLAQLVIGYLLDTRGARSALMGVAALQAVFFTLVQGQTGILAYCSALGFMLGVFGQIPINDFLVGSLASGPYRARVYGARYLVSFTVLALALPVIAFVHEAWGFDALFLLLAGLSVAIGAISSFLPGRTNEAAAA